MIEYLELNGKIKCNVSEYGKTALSNVEKPQEKHFDKYVEKEGMPTCYLIILSGRVYSSIHGNTIVFLIPMITNFSNSFALIHFGFIRAFASFFTLFGSINALWLS